MLKTSYNILEDERIESNTMKNQKGSEIRFNFKNFELGKILNTASENSATFCWETFTVWPIDFTKTV